MTTFQVCVEVATMWASPRAPRPIDASAVADQPDLRAWTAALGSADRLGLHGLILTQLLLGEPVELRAEGPAGWVQVASPWQPSPDDPRGYLGWVRSAHVAPSPVTSPNGPRPPTGDVPLNSSAVLNLAREHLGLRYLWGGTSTWGFDCSGLVHYCLRRAGLVVPRDAYAQHAATEPVPLTEERPGDLYFFAERGRVIHVGFVAEPGEMLHAPEASDAGPAEGRIEEAPLSPARTATLVGAGRLFAPG